MAGITRIATYVPRRRLDRTVIGQTWGTRVAPGRQRNPEPGARRPGSRRVNPEVIGGPS